MTDVKVWHWAGWCGMAGAILLLFEIPLSHVAHTQYLASIRVVVLTRVLLDMGMYVSLIVFLAGFHHLILTTRSEYGWVATLALAAGLAWWAVTLVAHSLEGAAALNTLGGKADPTAVRALVEGTLLIYNGFIAFTVTGLFMASAGYATLATGALPKWTGWIACASAVLCLAAIPSMGGGGVDPRGAYNFAVWGPVIVAYVLPLIWFLVASISMIRKREGVAPTVA
jgi:hypothetical protein